MGIRIFVKRRTLFHLFGTLAAWASEGARAIRGRLKPGSPARIGDVELTGDGPTLLVLADERLKDSDFEAIGLQESPSTFRVDPIHKRNLFVHKDGKRLMISYWCDVCSIRTWAPGVCLCCQDETALDMKEQFETVK